MRVYMDVCCLNRPFDDLKQPKVYLEAEAIMSIISLCESGAWTLVSSSAIDFETSKITDLARLKEVVNICHMATVYATFTAAEDKRAKYFQQHGIKELDSYHLALAESSSVNALLTTDKQFINAASRIPLQLAVVNPASWFMEVMNNE